MPYAEIEARYQSRGWLGLLPLPKKKKSPPPKGFTGEGTPFPSDVDRAKWEDREGNYALRLPGDVIGIDVDDYGAKHGGKTLAELERDFGVLPPTWISTAREGVSGIRYYKVEPGRHWANPGRDIDTIQHSHRYAVVPPSVHPSGVDYEWFNPEGQISTEPPAVSELPKLPDRWFTCLDEGEAIARRKANMSKVDRGQALTSGGVTPDSLVEHELDKADWSVDHPAQARHDEATSSVMKLLRLGVAGQSGVDTAIQILKEKYIAAVGGDRPGVAAEFDRMVETALPKVLADAPPLIVEEVELHPNQLPVLGGQVGDWDAVDLGDTHFPDMLWSVKDLLPAGLGILSASPKTGKSFLALQFCCAIATGTKVIGFDSTPGSVLYLALEDGARRVRKRLLDQAAYQMLEPGRLTIRTESPRLDEGGYDALKTWLNYRSDARLVVIDVFQYVRSAADGSGKRSVYAEDYNALKPLRNLAQKYGITVLVIHHNRKAQTEDFLESISGSTGMTGAPDFAMVLRRPRAEALGTLDVSGREVEERKLALEFKHAVWEESGVPPGLAGVSPEDRQFWYWLDSQTEPVSSLDIQTITGKTAGTANKMLLRMVSEGLVEQVCKAAPDRPAQWKSRRELVDLPPV